MFNTARTMKEGTAQSTTLARISADLYDRLKAKATERRWSYVTALNYAVEQWLARFKEEERDEARQ